MCSCFGGAEMRQKFGGPWTLIKLEVLEKYLNFYTTALKNQPFKLCYIDAFAGSGKIDIRGEIAIPGSAIRALDYPFHEYYFFEKEQSYITALKKEISKKHQHKSIIIMQGDCNQLLKTLSAVQWKKEGWRGVIFIDPFAMELRWESLKVIAQTEAFDVWYLFPLMAMNRLLRRDRRIPDSYEEKLNILLGTDDWRKELYRESRQLSFLDNKNLEKCSIDSIREYIIRRLKTVFPGVSDNAKILTNVEKRAPLFLICFCVSNPSDTAIRLSLKAADHILTHIVE
jgi:three-Cys-motif partner protein